MTDFLPFRGLKYNLSKFVSLDDLICPPFDLISSDQKKTLEGKSSHNAVWLEGTSSFNDSNTNKYIESRNTFNEWLNNEVIIRDESPAYHLIKYTYGLNRSTFSVTGIIGILRVEDPSTNNIIGHENTYLPIVEDRIQLLTTTGVQFSPILAAFKNSSDAIKKVIRKTLQNEPTYHVNIQDSEFSDSDYIEVWAISDNDDIKSIKNTISNSKVFIADGHHRYGAALGIQNSENATFESKHIMAALIDINDPGLQILPYHRVIDHIDNEFIATLHNKLSAISSDYSEYDLDGIASQDIPNLIENLTQSSHAICTLDIGTLRVYTINTDSVPADSGALSKSDAWILQTQVIEPSLIQHSQCELRYTHDLHQAICEVMVLGYSDTTCIGIFLGPFPKEAFEQVALSETNMPPKSTFFYPKMPTGLLFHPINMDT